MAQELINCRNKCKTVNNTCMRDCPVNETCRAKCIESEPTNECFDSCKKTACYDKCGTNKIDCDNKCISLHGSEKDKAMRNFSNSERKIIKNVVLVKEDTSEKCGDINNKRYICDKSYYCDKNSNCVEGEPDEDDVWYEKKFRLCNDMNESYCFDNVDSRGLFRKPDKNEFGEFITEKKLNTVLLEPSAEDIQEYNKIKDDKTTKKKISYGKCGMIDGISYVCNNTSYCDPVVIAEEEQINKCIIGELPEKLTELHNNRICRNKTDTSCYEVVEAIGTYRLGNPMNDMFMDAVEIEEDIMIPNEEICSNNKFTQHITNSNIDEKCGNYKVETDLVKEEVLRITKVCKSGLYCDTIRQEDETVKQCRVISEELDLEKLPNNPRMCRNKLDKKCFYKQVPNKNSDLGFNMGCYQITAEEKSPIPTVDEKSKVPVDNTFKIYDLTGKNYTVIKQLPDLDFKDVKFKKLPEVLEKETIKCAKTIIFENAELVEDNQKCGMFQISHDGTEKEIAKICKMDSYCATDNLCKKITDTVNLDTNVYRVCRNDTDTNCVKKLNDSGYLHYSRICVN